MAKFLLHSAFLATAVALAFFWTNIPQLSLYNLQIIALFVVLFFLNQFWAKKRFAGGKNLIPGSTSRANLTIDAMIFTLVVMLLVYSTGGLTSPLFFLVYFLLFGLALLFEPLVTLSLTGVMILFFFFFPNKQEPLTEALQLFSLILITPLALFFGTQYLKVLEGEEKIKILKEETEIMEGQIAKTETDTLLWTTLNLKKGLEIILDEISLLLSDLAHLTISQKERLLKIRQKVLELLKSGEKLKKEVDKTTDE